MITSYFVQHGLAESKQVDATRPLSMTGIEQTRKVATRLKQNGVVVNRIYHSGKLRAAQTAQIFSDVMQVNLVAELAGMNPNDDPQIIIDQITENMAMYVGHLPNIQNVVSSILANGEQSPVVNFQNSAVACIDMEKDHSALKWFLVADSSD